MFIRDSFLLDTLINCLALNFCTYSNSYGFAETKMSHFIFAQTCTNLTPSSIDVGSQIAAQVLAYLQNAQVVIDCVEAYTSVK